MRACRARPVYALPFAAYPACGRRWPNTVGSDERHAASPMRNGSSGGHPHPTRADARATFSHRVGEGSRVTNVAQARSRIAPVSRRQGCAPQKPYVTRHPLFGTRLPTGGFPCMNGDGEGVDREIRTSPAVLNGMIRGLSDFGERGNLRLGDGRTLCAGSVRSRQGIQDHQ